MMNFDFKNDFLKCEIIDILKEIRYLVFIVVFGLCNEFNLGGIICLVYVFFMNEIYIIEVSGFYKKGVVLMLPYERENIRNWNSVDDFIKSIKGRNIVAFERRESLTTKDIR